MQQQVKLRKKISDLFRRFSDCDGDQYVIFSVLTDEGQEDAKTKMNWWIQWWNSAELACHTWYDGKDSKKITIDIKDFDLIEDANSRIFILPKTLFKGFTDLTVTYHAGAHDAKGKTLYSSDTSVPFKLE